MKLLFFHNKKELWTILLLGFSSGLPAALIASTLQAWFTEAGATLYTIGAMSLLGLPYFLRFLWAPLLDQIIINNFNRRRFWLYVTQLGLMASITCMAIHTPEQKIWIDSYSVPILFLFAFLTAIFSASQDLVISAYQIELFPQKLRGLGIAFYTIGWRIGVITSGAIALIIASKWGWKITYLLMAGLMFLGIFATWLGPKLTYIKETSLSFKTMLFTPLFDFFHRFGFKGALAILSLIMTYKMGDALALALNTTFLLREVGFDLSVLGSINKTVSLLASIVGGVTAGFLMTQLTIYRSLLWFGLFQSVTHLGFILFLYWGDNIYLLGFVAFIENFSSGMGTIALLAFIMSLCNLHYTATQFALLTAFSFLSRIIIGPISIAIVDSVGWENYYLICFFMSLFTLIFVWINKKRISPI